MSRLTITLPRSRRGVTLVELLVVVTLLSILLGIAATAARTGARGKKQREAARQVNAFIAGARTRAIELDRSVGVEIVNNRPNEPQAGLTLFMVETPPPYSGDLTTSVCQMSEKPSTALGGRTARLNFDVSTASLLADDSFLQVNDVIFLGYGNQPYRVAQVDPVASGLRPVIIAWDVDQPEPLPWIAGTGTLMSPPTTPFTIFRKPQRNSVSPLQIPTGVCIDLRFSGIGTLGSELTTALPGATGVTTEDYPKIMFSPNGSVDAMYVEDSVNSTATNIVATRGLPTGNVNLLVGRYDKVISVTEWLAAATPASKSLANMYLLAPPEDGSNLADPEAMWISINRITGHIATTNNAVVNGVTGATTDAEILASSRRFAKQAQSISGR